MPRLTSTTGSNESGVSAASEAGPGVLGRSNQDCGVIGFHRDPHFEEGPANYPGVSSAGVLGASDEGPGIWGYSRSGPAGQFWGDVYVQKNLTVDGDLFLPGADCAELFTVGESIEPGDVLVIDSDGVLRRGATPYDKRVAGVVSGAGPLRPGMTLGFRNSGSDRSCPLALIGTVYCKVDARTHPIEVGDLLTTSMTPGHAMKAVNPSHAFGAVLGKALGDLERGLGLLPILVCLQ